MRGEGSDGHRASDAPEGREGGGGEGEREREAMGIGPATPRRVGEREGGRVRGEGSDGHRACDAPEGREEGEREREWECAHDSWKGWDACMHGGGRVWGFAARTMAPARWNFFPGCQGYIVE